MKIYFESESSNSKLLPPAMTDTAEPFGNDGGPFEDLFSSLGGLEMESPVEQAARSIDRRTTPPADPWQAGPPPQSPPDSNKQLSRVIVVSGMAHVADDQIQAIFQRFGSIRSMHSQLKRTAGFSVLIFNDVRHALSATQQIEGTTMMSPWSPVIQHVLSEMDRRLAGASITVTLNGNLTCDELLQLVSVCGPVLEVREHAIMQQTKLIEYYDIQSAELALETLSRLQVTSHRVPSQLPRRLVGSSVSPSSRALSAWISSPCKRAAPHGNT